MPTLPLVLVASIIGTVSLLSIAWKARSLGVWALTILALTYPLGKSLQALVVGPQWVRHYLSDAGFVPFMVLSWMIGLSWLQRREGATERGPLWAVPATLFFLALGLAGEAVQWMMGTGDWIDAACEGASAVGTAALARNIESAFRASPEGVRSPSGR